jgi:hypothetical protein
LEITGQAVGGKTESGEAVFPVELIAPRFTLAQLGGWRRWEEYTMEQRLLVCG